jgi:hypothetical protein
MVERMNPSKVAAVQDGCKGRERERERESAEEYKILKWEQILGRNFLPRQRRGAGLTKTKLAKEKRVR